jgi:hypothetical protein
MNLNEDKVRFCVRFLIGNGVTPDVYKTLCTTGVEPQHSYAIVMLDDDFFTKAAQGLWDMWPQGKKDDKYPWKESVPVLKERLEFIWSKLKVTGDYSVDDILQAGRRYLAQYEHSSTKYMQLLKYFIFKQKDVGVTEKGIIKKSYESMLVKMLQEKDKEEQIPFDEFIV